MLPIKHVWLFFLKYLTLLPNTGKCMWVYDTECINTTGQSVPSKILPLPFFKKRIQSPSQLSTVCTVYSTGTVQSTALYYPRWQHMQCIFFTFSLLHRQFPSLSFSNHRNKIHIFWSSTPPLPPPFRHPSLSCYSIFRPSALPLHRLFALPIFCCHSSRAVL